MFVLRASDVKYSTPQPVYLCYWFISYSKVPLNIEYKANIVLYVISIDEINSNSAFETLDTM